MQIILLEKVLNLGQLGEVVKVREGYARNFLIPQGKAKRATKASLEEFEKRRERASVSRGHGDLGADGRAVRGDGVPAL